MNRVLWIAAVIIVLTVPLLWIFFRPAPAPAPESKGNPFEERWLKQWPEKAKAVQEAVKNGKMGGGPKPTAALHQTR